MFRKVALAAFAATVGVIAASLTTGRHAPILDLCGSHDHCSPPTTAGRQG